MAMKLNFYDKKVPKVDCNHTCLVHTCLGISVTI